MILADSSAWIDFTRPGATALAARMSGLLRDRGVAVTEPVLMEVLAGARTDAGTEALHDLLHAQPLLPIDADADFVMAATVYRLCRRTGVTPRGLIDCLLAAIAWRTGASILTADLDLVRIGSVVGVLVERP